MEIYLDHTNELVSWALFGLIWVVQLVHYPSFHYVDPDRFVAFHRHHTRSISFIVLPLMLVELGLGAVLVWQSDLDWKYITALIIVGLIWASTFLIQVPDHNALGKGKDDSLIARLVKTNWIRTVLWTLKALWLSLLS